MESSEALFPIEKLPIELKLKVMECSSGIDLANLESASSEWRNLIRSSDNLWEKMCYKILKQLPDSLNLKELPPEGLSWKELFMLWTVISRNRFRFCWFFREKNTDALDKLFCEALPHFPMPVKYYADFASSSSDSSDSDNYPQHLAESESESGSESESESDLSISEHHANSDSESDSDVAISEYQASSDSDSEYLVNSDSS